MSSLSNQRPSYEHPLPDDLELLLATLPPRIRASLDQMDDRGDLLEVVMDLGRQPEARFAGREVRLGEEEVTGDELTYVVSHIGTFGDDNRAGIPRTLHRISAIRNRMGKVVGLTCRAGRSVLGTMDIIRDFVEGEKSTLILGKPGVGKTTLLREAARVLADEFKKRVIIVDTSNEIAGDGDIPHPGIGRARRMQVPTPTQQHAVMIEAVENHMPEVIVIDEIGTELEAEAARTIAERGVQLVATAHGNSLENLMMNPTLADLVGGIQPVTLGDEEARRRGTQKTVLERKAPPTFDVLVEMHERQKVAVHRDVSETVDAALRGQPITVEIRRRRDDGQVERRLEVPRQRAAGDERHRRNPGRGQGLGLDYENGRLGWGEAPGGGGRGSTPAPWDERPLPLAVPGYEGGGSNGRSQAQRRAGHFAGGGGLRRAMNSAGPQQSRARSRSGWDQTAHDEAIWSAGTAPAVAGGTAPAVQRDRLDEQGEADDDFSASGMQPGPGVEGANGDRFRRTSAASLRPLKLYPYGVNRDRLESAIAALRLPVTITKDSHEADVVMTLKNYYRKSPGPVRDAEGTGKPVSILKSNTTGQIQQSLEAIYALNNADPGWDIDDLVLRETEDAINRVLHTDHPVELPPQNAYIRRLQHQLAEEFNVNSRSTGREPHRRVKLFKQEIE